MGILNALEDAASAAVGGAKDMLGLGDEKQETVETAVAASLDDTTPVAETNEVAQAIETAAPTETVRTYTVHSGDTLSKISKEFYGNSHDYIKIFEANRDNLSDPDDIQIGQELVIPN